MKPTYRNALLCSTSLTSRDMPIALWTPYGRGYFKDALHRLMTRPMPSAVA